jgi:hypothetical protein
VRLIADEASAGVGGRHIRRRRCPEKRRIQIVL